MLLRRITEHVKAQNWFAVFLDFVIVVVGVFIGIQLGNWNEARVERIEEKRIVLRLIDEAQQSADGIILSEEFTNNQLASARRAHAFLLTGDATQSDALAFGADLLALGPWERSGFVTATLDQIIASGAIDTIRGGEILNTIAQYRVYVIKRRESIQNVGTMNMNHVMIMRESFDLDYGASPLRLSTPVAELIDNAHLRRRIGQLVYTYSEMANMHTQSQVVNAEYLEALTAYSNEQGWIK